MTNLSEHDREHRFRGVVLGVYARFEHVVIYLLTLLIAILVIASVWDLILSTARLFPEGIARGASDELFQPVFGTIFTVLIALEFKRSLIVILQGHSALAELQSVLLIAMLALVRKFIILDVKTTPPAVFGTLAGSILALGVVFWLARTPAPLEVREAGQSPPEI